MHRLSKTELSCKRSCEFHNPRKYRGDRLKATLPNPTSGSLKRDLIERVYIPKRPPYPNSRTKTPKTALLPTFELQTDRNRDAKE